jgi:hypothetical protein
MGKGNGQARLSLSASAAWFAYVVYPGMFAARSALEPFLFLWSTWLASLDSLDINLSLSLIILHSAEPFIH